MKTPHAGQIELLHLNHDQVRALASPMRSEVFSTLSAQEAVAIREVAAELGKSPAAVGEHVAALVEAGLVIPAGTRKRRSRTETLYVHKALTTRFILRGQPPETVEAYLSRFRGQMRLAERQYEMAQRAVLEEPSFQSFLAYKWANAYVTPEGAERIQAAIGDLINLVQEVSVPGSRDGTDGEPVRVTFSALLLPTQSESRRVKGRDRE